MAGSESSMWAGLWPKLLVLVVVVGLGLLYLGSVGYERMHEGAREAGADSPASPPSADAPGQPGDTAMDAPAESAPELQAGAPQETEPAPPVETGD